MHNRSQASEPVKLPQRLPLRGSRSGPGIAAGWSQVREVLPSGSSGSSRGADGRPLNTASTGVGAPGTAILLEELAKLGARTFIRVGNSGGLAPALEPGRARGDHRRRPGRRHLAELRRPEYPAAADYRVVAALVDAAPAQGAHCHAGVTWSLDAFYARNAVQAADGSSRR